MPPAAPDYSSLAEASELQPTPRLPSASFIVSVRLQWLAMVTKLVEVAAMTAVRLDGGQRQ